MSYRFVYDAGTKKNCIKQKFMKTTLSLHFRKYQIENHTSAKIIRPVEAVWKLKPVCLKHWRFSVKNLAYFVNEFFTVADRNVNLFNALPRRHSG